MANLGYSFLLVLTAFIWGTTFVAQVEGNIYGPFVFNCIRCFIGVGFLFLLVKFFDILGLSTKRPRNRSEQKYLWKSGVICGFVLFFATNLQQLGMYLGTSAGKSGFLTACYIILVPFISIFLGKKNSLKIWICVFLTLTGLYLLCIKEDFSIQFSDLLLLFCALMFSTQILIVDKVICKVDEIRLSCIQFLTVGILTIIPMIFVDFKCNLNIATNVLEAYTHPKAWGPLLYAAILSTGVAYTLQIVAQNKIKPTIASLLMSLESVFAVLAGWAILGEQLTFREAMGCIIMAVAVVLAQVNINIKRPDHDRQG